MSLLAPPAAPINTYPLSEPSTNTNRTASHGRPVLETGHGLKDWIRLCQRSTDLSGTNGHMLRVTADELAKHCTEEDAWTAINGRVYNITPYLPFHPGSASELMRGAGKDCTDLFNQYHPYLQFDRFLSNCFVGNLIHEGPQSRKVSSPAYLYIPGLQPHLPKLSPSPPPVTTTAEKIAENNSGNRWCVRKNSYHEPVLEEVEDSTSCTPSTDTPDSGIIQAVPDSLPGISISVEEPTEGSTAVSCPRYEWYQTNSTVVVAFYTRFKGLKSTNLQVDMDRGMGFTASLFLGEHVHTLSWQLEREVERTAVAVRGTTVELTMYKKERGLHWRQLSVVSEDSTTAVNKREPVYREGTLVSVEEVTHNTKLFTFRLPPGLYMNVPVGHHVKLCGHLEGEEIARSYTPISSLNPAPCPRGAVQCDTLQLMVKLYSDGKMSRVLSALTEGESLLIGEPEGEFDWESVRAKKICLIAAGSGFTPMVKITSAALGRSEETEVTLIFANRSERDILWQAELERLQDTFSTRFQVVHTLSNPSPSWTGLRGRITSPLLQEYLPQPGDCCRGDLLVCVCGMYQFTVAVTQALKGLGYSEEDIHVFV